MAEATAARPVGLPTLQIPVRQVVPWAVFVGVMMMLVLYFVGVDQGATSLISGSLVHEFLHDGRHLLGFPCH